ncbi:hypothetical protein [Mycolicibacterium diernhoferi]|nr:hypothetical protein [Mycolicibacterium diernhoferi]QYL20740.1 hypothetical protein K0O62_16835 [Mycolicibacterium diernhoferi]
MRLIDSSDSEQVTRYNVRSHYTQRLVLVAALCRELQRHPDDLVGGRPQAALNVLNLWMVEAYDLPRNRDIGYQHGLDDPRLAEYASHIQRELELGTKVCEAYFMLFTADTQSDYDRDRTRIRERLDHYVAEFG